MAHTGVYVASQPVPRPSERQSRHAPHPRAQSTKGGHIHVHHPRGPSPEGGAGRRDRRRPGRRELRDRERGEQRRGLEPGVVGRDDRHPPATPAPSGHGGPGGRQPWGGQRGDETPLTGDTAAKVEAAAKAKVPGGTVVRVETDADGHAKYEAHMTDADGTPVTVYVGEDFAVVSVERR